MRKATLFVAAALLPFLASCVGPAIAEDLLQNVERQATPISASAPTIHVTINEAINNSEGLDESVKQSLEIALRNANLFGEDAGDGCRIDADIVLASMSAIGFGSFEGKFDVHYVVRDDGDRTVFDETIKTVAGSDSWYFSGAARHRRSRAVQMANNVLEFVDRFAAAARP